MSKQLEKTGVSTLLDDLRSKGGVHAPWYEVEGATIGSVLRAAIASGEVQITPDGGLRITKGGGEFATTGPGLLLAGDDDGLQESYVKSKDESEGEE